MELCNIQNSLGMSIQKSLKFIAMEAQKLSAKKNPQDGLDLQKIRIFEISK
jgi:hypothetical protein